MKASADVDRTATYADMFAALGAESRLRILRLLLSAHPDGMVVGEIQHELGIAASTLSHHLEKLKTKTSSRLDVRELFCAIRPTLRRWRNSSAFYMPSAVLATKPLSRPKLPSSANWRNDIEIREAVKEKYGQASPREAALVVMRRMRSTVHAIRSPRISTMPAKPPNCPRRLSGLRWVAAVRRPSPS